MPRRPFRTVTEAANSITIMKARLNLVSTTLSEAIAEAKSERPDLGRVVALLTKARQHSSPLNIGASE